MIQNKTGGADKIVYGRFGDMIWKLGNMLYTEVLRYVNASAVMLLRTVCMNNVIPHGQNFGFFRKC